jgi:S-(hydroxymethyl)glutathione dehydrogenase/alcohol dehydrogenase
VIVVGIGGIGMNALQGAAHAGAMQIIAVDPVPYKRERASEFGATHTAETIGEATELAQSMTNGQGADSAIVTVGITNSDHVAGALSAIRKGGTVAVAGLGKMTDDSLPISISELTFFQKRLQGSLYGASSPSYSVLRLLDLYQAGLLKLDELITSTYTLDQVNDGYADMHAGKNIRGVIEFG